MNYIQLINEFWSIRRSMKITSYEADLYYYLLKECNSRMWLNPFDLSTNLICAELGISRKTLSDLRNRLKQKGFIDFKEGQKNKSSAIYELMYVSESNIQGNVLGNIQGNLLNKTETKTKTVKKLNKKKVEDVFEEFRKSYPGTKQGFKTEFENFCKKHSDYQDAVFLLKPALERLIIWRNSKRQAGQFVPEHAHLKTWINQRRWEVEFENLEKGGNNGQKGSRSGSGATQEEFAEHIAGKLGGGNSG